MRPLYLKFKGINSYIDWAQIDFTKFEKHKIFGIFGRTGHGKSTILDAITYALYGIIDRLGAKSVKEAINPVVGYMESIFRFETEKGIYEIKRKHDGVRSEVALYKVDGGIKHPVVETRTREVAKALSSLIGDFEYEHFSKVVILPQGKFAEFLKEPTHKRAESLSKIFNLEKFGAPLYELVKNAMRELEGEIGSIRNQLDELADISEDAIKEKEKSIKETKDKIKKFESAIKKKREYVEKLERGVKLKKELKEVEDNLKELLKEEPTIKECHKRLAEAEELRELIAHKENVTELVPTIESLEGELEKKKEQLKIKDEKLTALEEEFEKFEKLEEEKRKSIAERRKAVRDAEDEIRKLKKKKEKLIEERGNLKELKGKLLDILDDETLGEIKRLDDEISDFIMSVGEIGWSIDDEILVLLKEEAQEEILSYIEGRSRLNKLKGKLEERERKLEEIEENLREMWESELEIPYPGYEKAQSKIYEIEGEIEGKIEDTQKKLDEARRKNLYASIASELKPGEPCPVCGSKEHPAPAIEKEKEEKLKNLEEELKKLKEKRSQIKSFKKTIDKELQNLTGIAKLKSKEEGEIKEIEMALELTGEKIKEKLKDVKEVSLEKIEELKKKSEEKERIRKSLLEERETLGEKLSNLREQFYKWDKLISYVEGELRRIEDLLERDERDIGEFLEKLNKLTGGKKLSETEDELEEEERRLNEEKRKLKETLEKARKALDKLKDEITGLKEKIKNKKENLEESRKKLESEAKRRGVEVNELLERILPSEEIEKLRERIDDFNRRKSELEGKIKTLKGQIETLSLVRIDENVLDKEKVNLEKLEKAKDDMKEKLGKLKEELKNVKENLEKKEKLLETLDEKEKNLKLHRELEFLLKGKKLVQFAARYMLEAIVEEANIYTKELTGGRLTLLFDPNGFDFEVFDHTTGAIRPSSTLSGGETFIVSFSLALSLSKHIQTIKGKSLHFFFIDEGFGTLDNETLSSVAEVLNQLKMEDILVGFITHLEYFKQMVPAYIFVRKDPVRGSYLELFI